MRTRSKKSRTAESKHRRREELLDDLFNAARQVMHHDAVSGEVESIWEQVELKKLFAKVLRRYRAWPAEKLVARQEG